MKFQKPIPVKVIAAETGCRLIGDDSILATGLNEIHRVEHGDITFVDHPKYYDKVLGSPATVILIDRETQCPQGKALLVYPEPFSIYNSLANTYAPFEPLLKNPSPTSKIGKGTIIQPGAVIGNDVVIGENCLIHSNVVIYDRCKIGNEVIIHSGSVIGSDAFYFKKEGERYIKWHACGRVIIGNRVEIGAGCTIDRGVSSDTSIGDGTKFDNQVHIGHDTVIGKNCLFAAQVAVAGVVRIEDGVTLWGQVGINKDLILRKGSVVMAQSGLGKNTDEGKSYFGSPASEAKEKLKEMILVRRLPELFKELEAKEKLK